nr:MAG TPA: hypothetical protein [Caudoviricetes sp.]
MALALEPVHLQTASLLLGQATLLDETAKDSGCLGWGNTESLTDTLGSSCEVIGGVLTNNDVHNSLLLLLLGKSLDCICKIVIHAINCKNTLCPLCNLWLSLCCEGLNLLNHLCVGHNSCPFPRLVSWRKEDHLLPS